MTAACGGNREARLEQRSAFSKPCQGAAEKAASATRKARRMVRRAKKPLRGFFRCAAREIHEKCANKNHRPGGWWLVIAEGAGFADLLPVLLYLEPGRNTAVDNALIRLTIAGFNPIIYQWTLDTGRCAVLVWSILYITQECHFSSSPQSRQWCFHQIQHGCMRYGFRALLYLRRRHLLYHNTVQIDRSKLRQKSLHFGCIALPVLR